MEFNRVRVGEHLRSIVWLKLVQALGASLLLPAVLAGSPAAQAGNMVEATAKSSTTCTYSLSATSLLVPISSASNQAVYVTSQPGCTWTATTSSTFATISSGASGSGSGNGAVRFSLSTNTGMTRTAVFRIAGLVYTATQEGAIKPPVASSTIPAFTNTGPFTVETLDNQAFGTVPVSTGNGSLTLMLKFYYPVINQSPLPALPVYLLVHGGGWADGNRESCMEYDYSTVTEQLVSLCDTQAARGYVVVGIDYRLSSQAIFPAQIEDIQGAVRFLRAHANSFATINGTPGFIMDTSRIGAFGSSAGGHLDSLLGVSANNSSLEGTLNPGYSASVQAVVPWFGESELTELDSELLSDFGAGTFGVHDSPTSAESALLGCTLGSPPCSTPAEDASPLTYVTGSEPPYLLRHGTMDKTVPYQQSQLMYNALVAAGNYADLEILSDPNIAAGIGHAFEYNICTAGEGNPNPDPSLNIYYCSDVARAALMDSQAFFDHVLRGL